MQASTISAPVVSAADTPAPRSSQDAGTPEKPFNTVLQQELDGRERSSAQATAAKPVKGSSAASKTDKAATGGAQPAPAEVSQRNAADDASDIEAGIASLSLELAAMVTNLLQLHGKAAPADKSKKPATESTSDASKTNGASVDIGILGVASMAAKAVTSEANTQPLKADSNDMHKSTTKETATKDPRSSKADTAEASAAIVPAIPVAAGEVQPVGTGLTAEAPAQFASSLLAVNLSLPSPPTPNALPVSTPVLTPPVGTAAWDQALAQRVTWMVNGTQQSATLSLNPPELGPLQIVLSLTPTHADASFIASQPEVRQALEAALPKLREMLGDAGIQLGQASVNSGAPNSSGQFRQDAQPGKRRLHDGGDTTTLATPNLLTGGSGGLGLIDTFV